MVLCEDFGGSASPNTMRGGKLCRVDGDLLLALAVPLELDDAVDLGEDRVVGTQSHVFSGEKLGPALTDDDGSSMDGLAAERLDA